MKAPKSPAARTALCTIAIALISNASASLLGVVNGAPLEGIRALAIAAAFGAGAFLVYVGNCIHHTTSPRA